MAALCDNKSHFHETVHLHEWWLIWGENEKHEKRLAVAGYTSRGQRALRPFSSSPILRRHDVFTLETTDGTYVGINGLINKTRTEENGFPSEVFKCFFFGFPPHWEVCAEHYLAQGFGSNNVLREDTSLKGCRNASEQTVAVEKDTYQRKTVAVEKESILEENTASKEASTAGKKTCTDASRKFKESPKKSDKAVRHHTRFGGARNTDHKRIANVKKTSTSIQKAASKETSTPEKKSKRKLTHGSPVTPKADVITSVISPGLSSVKRSRSGRLLLPTLEYWRNQMAVYDLDHEVIGIKDGISTPSRGTEMTHESKRSVGSSKSKKNPNAAMDKSTHKRKRAVGRPRSKNDPDAAMDNSTHKPKRGRPRSKKDLDAAVEIKSTSRRRINIGSKLLTHTYT